MGVLLQDFCNQESISGIRLLLICHWRSQLPFGGQNWRSTGGQILKSTVQHLWVSFYRFFVSRNLYLALEYCSDVTGGRNCHLEVKTGGQTLKFTVQNLWVSFYRFFCIQESICGIKYCLDVTGGHNCHLEVKTGGQLEVKH